MVSPGSAKQSCWLFGHHTGGKQASKQAALCHSWCFLFWDPCGHGFKTALHQYNGVQARSNIHKLNAFPGPGQQPAENTLHCIKLGLGERGPHPKNLLGTDAGVC